MKRCLLGCLLLLFAADMRAHRLDEYLQAVRVAVATHRVDLSLELTPGVAIASKLLPRIDKDQDGQISSEERDAYARRVLKDLRVALDKKTLTLRLVDASFPELREVREGLGVVRIQATASVSPLASGRHTLKLTNKHLPSLSVYQVNALVPRDDAIQILGQSRDKHQKRYRLNFGVKPVTPR